MHWLSFANLKVVNSNETSNSYLQGKMLMETLFWKSQRTLLNAGLTPTEEKWKIYPQGSEKPVNRKPWGETIRQNGGNSAFPRVWSRNINTPFHNETVRELDTESRAWHLWQHVQVVYQPAGWLKSGSMRFVTGIEPVNVRHQASFFRSSLRLLWFQPPPLTWIATFKDKQL